MRKNKQQIKNQKQTQNKHKTDPPPAKITTHLNKSTNYNNYKSNRQKGNKLKLFNMHKTHRFLKYMHYRGLNNLKICILRSLLNVDIMRFHR